MGEALTGKGILAQLNLETGIPIYEAEPLLLFFILFTLLGAIGALGDRGQFVDDPPTGLDKAVIPPGKGIRSALGLKEGGKTIKIALPDRFVFSFYIFLRLLVFMFLHKTQRKFMRTLIVCRFLHESTPRKIHKYHFSVLGYFQEKENLKTNVFSVPSNHGMKKHSTKRKNDSKRSILHTGD